MRKLLGFVALILTLAAIAGQPGLARGTSSIQGSVTDAKHNRPLMSVMVVAFEAHSRASLAQTETDRDGAFHFRNLGAGDYRLVMTKAGYRSIEVDGLTVETSEHMIVGTPIALQTASLGESDPIQLVARCNNVVNPDETADVYVFCGNQ
jgi:uncharacterized surface anchored protein